jgi:hypothetical protein
MRKTTKRSNFALESEAIASTSTEMDCTKTDILAAVHIITNIDGGVAAVLHTEDKSILVYLLYFTAGRGGRTVVRDRRTDGHLIGVE